MKVSPETTLNLINVVSTCGVTKWAECSSWISFWMISSEQVLTNSINPLLLFLKYAAFHVTNSGKSGLPSVLDFTVDVSEWGFSEITSFNSCDNVELISGISYRKSTLSFVVCLQGCMRSIIWTITIFFSSSTLLGIFCVHRLNILDVEFDSVFGF